MRTVILSLPLKEDTSIPKPQAEDFSCQREFRVALIRWGHDRLRKSFNVVSQKIRDLGIVFSNLSPRRALVVEANDEQIRSLEELNVKVTENKLIG